MRSSLDAPYVVTMLPYFRTISLEDPSLVSAYDELPLWSGRFAALLLDNIQIRNYESVLDVGCAAGFPLFELARNFGPDCRVVGIDTWQQALDRAADKRTAYQANNVELVCADAEQMPFADQTFDLVVSHLGVNNFADPQAAMRECARVAKPGGFMVIISNLYGHYAELYEVYRQVLRDLNLEEFLPRLEAQERHRSTIESLHSSLRASGFEPSRTIEDKFTMRYASGTAFLNHQLTVIGFVSGWRKIVTPETEYAVFNALEQRLNEIAEREGELRMTVPMAFVEGVR